VKTSGILKPWREAPNQKVQLHLAMTEYWKTDGQGTVTIEEQLDKGRQY